MSASFDEPNFVPCAGLLPAAALAQRLDVAGVVDERLALARHGAKSGTKAMTVIGSMLAGGDSIDDTDLLRAGALPALFDQGRAPSTIGTWLRDFKWHNVRQLDAGSRELLVRQWAAGAGPADLSGPLTFDLDSTIVAVFGRGKQGAAFGYTKIRGYHPQLATCAETGQVLFSRLRGGAAGAARGAKSFLTETISRVRAAGASGQLSVRADSAFYSKAVLHTAAKFDVRFSITTRQDQRIRAAIETIDEQAWTPIPYWLSTPQVSGADVAETSYTAFAGTTHAMNVRLIVRRVRPTPGSQLALFTTWDYHAFVTDRDGDMLELEADHRRHAIVEQSIAELKSAGLAHLPSSKFMANAAWLALAVIAHNLARAVGLLAGGVLHRATAATLRRAIFTIPGRLVTAAADDAYDYRRTGPGPNSSPPPWPRSSRSPCVADPGAPPSTTTQGPRRSRQTGNSILPSSHRHPHEDQLPARLINSRLLGGSGVTHPRERRCGTGMTSANGAITKCDHADVRDRRLCRPHDRADPEAGPPAGQGIPVG